MRPTRREVLAGGAALMAAPSDHHAGATRASRTSLGVNVYDLFLAPLHDRRREATKGRLEALASMKIPFVRFAGSGQFVSDWRLLEADPAAYWGAMDDVFETAERTGVKLVPSLIWEPAALAFSKGEPMSAWGNPGSKTREAARTYYKAVFARYAFSRNVLAWEYGNELNTWADWDCLKYWPKPDPDVHRSLGKADLITSVMVKSAYEDFTLTAGQYKRHSLSMGSDLPQPQAWNHAHGVDRFDTGDEFSLAYDAITPRNADLLSVHLYPSRIGGRDNFFQSMQAAVSACIDAARLGGRRLFIGEWGVPSRPGRAGDRDERALFYELLNTVQHSGAAFAAIWDYGRTTPDGEWRITLDNARRYQIEAIARANA